MKTIQTAQMRKLSGPLPGMRPTMPPQGGPNAAVPTAPVASPANPTMPGTNPPSQDIGQQIRNALTSQPGSNNAFAQQVSTLTNSLQQLQSQVTALQTDTDRQAAESLVKSLQQAAAQIGQKLKGTERPPVTPPVA